MTNDESNRLEWEASARKRLEKLVADTVFRVRKTADEIERGAKRNIANAAQTERTMEFQTYHQAVGQVLNSVQALMFNLPMESLIDAAGDSEAAHQAKAAEK